MGHFLKTAPLDPPENFRRPGKAGPYWGGCLIGYAGRLWPSMASFLAKEGSAYGAALFREMKVFEGGIGGDSFQNVPPKILALPTR